LKKYFIHKSVNRIKLFGVLLWILPTLTKHNVDVTLNVWTKFTGIIFVQYIYLGRTNSSIFIRAISEYFKNEWYMSTKSGVFQNLWALLQYAKAYHVC